VLYVRYGCINCHGANGLGGVPNPLSPYKSIPPLSGPGFRHDFPTDKAIYDVIRSGGVMGRAPIVSLPQYRPAGGGRGAVRLASPGSSIAVVWRWLRSSLRTVLVGSVGKAPTIPLR